MQDKLEKVREFIQANPGKSNRWYADNNGIIKKTTFYKYLNEIVMDRSTDKTDKTDKTDNLTDKTDKTDNLTDNLTDKTDKTDKTDNLTDKTDNLTDKTDTSEIIQNLFEEHEKNETRKLKNRQYNYNKRSRESLVEELQKENEELKSKYEELQSKYEQLQTNFIFEKQLKEKYENQIHDLPYKQSEFNELKKKYEKLQLDYFVLKNGKEIKDESKEKPKEQKSHNWWDEI